MAYLRRFYCNKRPYRDGFLWGAQCGYIDYQAFARDMTLNGEIIELNKYLLVTNPYDF